MYAYKNFYHSIFQSLIGLFGNILGAAPSAYHVQFESHHPDTILNVTTAPKVEIATMWFPTSYTPEDKEQTAKNAGVFLSMLEKKARDYKGSATGWVCEDIDVPGTDEKGKAFVMLIGWASVKAHTDFTNSQVFKDNIHIIMNAKDLKKIEAVHTSFMEIIGKGQPS
jgi:hypothetical protein